MQEATCSVSNYSASEGGGRTGFSILAGLSMLSVSNYSASEGGGRNKGDSDEDLATCSVSNYSASEGGGRTVVAEVPFETNEFPTIPLLRAVGGAGSCR